MEDKENTVDNPLPPVPDPLLEKIKNVFFDEYHPVYEFKPGILCLSTNEVYQMFQSLYPNEMLYTRSDVSTWLHEKGFHFIKMKELEYQWMLQPAKF